MKLLLEDGYLGVPYLIDTDTKLIHSLDLQYMHSSN